MYGELRKEIKQLIEDEVSVYTLTRVLDKLTSIELKFNQIRDLLNYLEIHNLNNIEEAYYIASEMSDRLYREEEK